MCKSSPAAAAAASGSGAAQASAVGRSLGGERWTQDHRHHCGSYNLPLCNPDWMTQLVYQTLLYTMKRGVKNSSGKEQRQNTFEISLNDL